ncbi:MAG: glycosyltransferase [Lachnospiraceae bacterium]|nr:glycosyltransferase [Lachnospiraceae bacterium]
MKTDRRILDNVPDTDRIRMSRDRRGGSLISKEDHVSVNDFIRQKSGGIRYAVDYDVRVAGKTRQGESFHFLCKGVDISTTGLLLRVDATKYQNLLEHTEKLKLCFEITPGSMPEGYEMKVKNCGIVRRIAEEGTDEGSLLVGVEFSKSLSQYANRKKGRYDLLIASIFLFTISLFIILMRAESVIYFRFNKWLYLYSIIAAVFLLSRYLFSMFYKAVPVNPDFTPGVTVIIPCFNEEEWIQRTVLSCMNQDYPIDKLEVIIVDDCSTDKSVEKVKEVMEQLYQEADRFQTRERLKCIVQHKNAGKREALVLGVEAAKHDLVVFVDSDSFLDPFAIRNLVQPFQDPKMGGCAGRTDVANTYTNSLTKMQAVRYYVAFRVMKAAEGCFDTVSCLSGPLSCYRREIIMENKNAWLQQKFLGQKATFGDDRSMTNFVLRKHRTTYQDTAICSTIVPSSHKVFLKQQMRWKRSWLRESLIAGRFMWRKEPFASLGFYMGLFVPIAAPVVVFYNLLYVPLVHHIFPTTFLVGILMMSLLMSMAQLLLRKSTTWIYGMLFCLYYEAVLLWQMPVAWVTFWKSTWGTRLTPSDLLAMSKKGGIQSGDSQAKEEEAGEETPTEGFSVCTAYNTCHLSDDTNLSPETGMCGKRSNVEQPAVIPMPMPMAAGMEKTIPMPVSPSVKKQIAQTGAVTVDDPGKNVPDSTPSADALDVSVQEPDNPADAPDVSVQKPDNPSDTKDGLVQKPDSPAETPDSAAYERDGTTHMLEQRVKEKMRAAMEEAIETASIELAEELRERMIRSIIPEIKEELKLTIEEELKEELRASMKKQVLAELLR